MLSRFKNFTWLETVVIVANVVVLALIAENSMRFKRYSPYVLNRRRAFADCKLIDEALSRFNKENQETIKTINHKTLEMLNKRAYLTLMPDEPQSYRLDKWGRTFSTKYGYGQFSKNSVRSWFVDKQAKAQVLSAKKIEVFVTGKHASANEFHYLNLGLITSGLTKEAVSMFGKLAFYDKEKKLRALIPWQLGGKKRKFFAEDIYSFSQVNPFVWFVDESAWEQEKSWLRDTAISQMSVSFCVEWICYADDSVEYF